MRGKLSGLQYMPNELNKGHEVRVANSEWFLSQTGSGFEGCSGTALPKLSLSAPPPSSIIHLDLPTTLQIPFEYFGHLLQTSPFFYLYIPVDNE